ncbi:Acetyl esterase/lipase [Georgenia satyanarayanai]|uniref:Acetyl esterase/lipase n=1 Tax=Georgenia satyanarayanai TaxID=860221 RepID=A0A2Y9ARG7_9MICO|nr:alpha/beta hydrolase [Georgenia satyanarayanai]PYF96328.1 acetyl esterase/lipase [Georgenia satyanarayanai]SSA47050.1 Acetyl esterase/lipase [Georgenia satyanarayanai]
MRYGLLAGLLVHGALVALTLVSPRRPAWLAGLSFRVAAAYNEAPFLILLVVLVGTVPGLVDGWDEPAGQTLTLVLTLLLVAGLLVIAWRGSQARPVVAAALDEGLGPDWDEGLDRRLREQLDRRPPLGRMVLPVVLRPRDVEGLRNIPYGDAGRAHLLDLYRHRSRPDGAPVLVHVHAGGYAGGRKSQQSRALLFRLAQRGWVTISANYRLRPHASFVDHLADLKRVIAWVREHGSEYGADPGTLVLAGGSAGAHMSSIAALTPNEPRYQPGFPEADTSVSAVVGLYGWYGGYYEVGGPTSEAGPRGHDASGAPPFFVAHGAKDSLAHAETARRFVAHLRAASTEPVVYAELPAGQHSFDLFRSPRFTAVVDGVEAFVGAVRSRG